MIPGVVERAHVFRDLPTVIRVQAGAAAVSRDAFDTYEYIPKGSIRASPSSSLSSPSSWVYPMFVQSNPDGRWEFDSFKFVVESTDPVLPLKKVLVAAERVARGIYKRWASDGVCVSLLYTHVDVDVHFVVKGRGREILQEDENNKTKTSKPVPEGAVIHGQSRASSSPTVDGKGM